MRTDDIQYPPCLGFRDVAGREITGLVIQDDSSDTVIETRLDDDDITLSQESRSTSGSPIVGVTGDST